MNDICMASNRDKSSDARYYNIMSVFPILYITEVVFRLFDSEHDDTTVLRIFGICLSLGHVTSKGYQVTPQGHQVTYEGHQVTSLGHVTSQGYQVTPQGHQVTYEGHQVTYQGHQVTYQGHQVTYQRHQVPSQRYQVTPHHPKYINLIRHTQY
jgi:uncharacterized Zn-binding protein involved in type VI secretion